MKKKAAGLIYGPQLQHMDHIATLCQWLKIPLIVTEADEEDLAKRYYPDLVVYQEDVLPAQQSIVRHFDIIFSSLPVDLFQEIFQVAERLIGKKLLSVWMPHGNSDKGYLSPFMQALYKERVALVYGPKMRDFLKEVDVYHKIQHMIDIGNYRYALYQKYKPFYDKILSDEIRPHLDPSKKTILYAPTWQDRENSGSLFNAGPIVIDRLKERYNLIVKVHPNIHLMSASKLEKVKGRFEDIPHLLFLERFPPVYPLLDLADLYIGDMSSIGYDFLTFDKPMIFLNHTERDIQTDKGLTLHQCGISLTPNQFEEIDEFVPQQQNLFSEKRRALYHHTFSEVDMHKKADEILQLCNQIAEDTLFL